VLFDEPVYSVPGASKESGLSTWTLWDYLKSGRIKRTKVGGKTFIRRSELLKLVVESVNREKPQTVVETFGPPRRKKAGK